MEKVNIFDHKASPNILFTFLALICEPYVCFNIFDEFVYVSIGIVRNIFRYDTLFPEVLIF